MLEMPGMSATRMRILEAAIELVSEQAGAPFSLEEVAKRAGLSKGGLLYNFPNKHSLITGMLEVFVHDIRQTLAAAEAEVANDPHPNKLARAFLISLRAKLLSETTPRWGIVAAIGEEPNLLDPIRTFMAQVFDRIEAESDNPALARTIFFAAEGIRTTRFFSMMPFSEEETLKQIDTMVEALANNTL